MAIAPAAVPWIMGAMSVASAGVGMIQQSRIASAQQDAQDEQNKQIRMNAAQQYGELGAAEKEAQQESLDQGIAQQKELLQSKGRVNLLAGASGTYGGAVDSMLSDLDTSYGDNLSTITRNRNTQLEDIRTQAENIRYGAQRQQGTRVFSKPSGVSAVAGLAMAGASGYMSGTKLADTMSSAAPAGGGTMNSSAYTDYGGVTGGR